MGASLCWWPGTHSKHLGDGHDVPQKSGKYPCVVCYCSVGKNPFLCSQCILWVHRTCSGIAKWLFEDPSCICPRWTGESRPIDAWTVTEVDVDGTMLNVESTFCYLGDMLRFGGGCDRAIAARWCVAWGKLKKLLPDLTTRHLSPKVCGKVCEACVRSAMLHGSETWGPKEPELRLCHNDHAMISWICGIKDRDRQNTLRLTTTETSRTLHQSIAPSTRKTWFECVKTVLTH